MRGVNAVVICQSCGVRLAEDERVYYGHRCEDCERGAWAKLKRWREGGEDADLAAAFRVRAPVVH